MGCHFYLAKSDSIYLVSIAELFLFQYFLADVRTNYLIDFRSFHFFRYPIVVVSLKKMIVFSQVNNNTFSSGQSLPLRRRTILRTIFWSSKQRRRQDTSPSSKSSCLFKKHLKKALIKWSFKKTWNWSLFSFVSSFQKQCEDAKK